MIEISVILPTYNPDVGRLRKTISGLQTQTLDKQLWELIIVNNNSSAAFADKIDLVWHPEAKIVAEYNQGLTFARLKGFSEAKGKVLVMVDDDNVLERGYLQCVLEIFQKDSRLGAVGGKSLPDFEAPPPFWITEFYANLALRDFGEEQVIDQWNFEYPAVAPIGAGMALRRGAIQTYIQNSGNNNTVISDRNGNSLGSGGDNDLILEVLKAGWRVGYFPSLCLRHIIPKERLQVNYLARLLNNTNRSWIAVLEKHRINPWPGIPSWTLPFRKIKAWFACRGWTGSVNYIKWRGACGLFDGLADIEHQNQ